MSVISHQYRLGRFDTAFGYRIRHCVSVLVWICYFTQHTREYALIILCADCDTSVYDSQVNISSCHHFWERFCGSCTWRTYCRTTGHTPSYHLIGMTTLSRNRFWRRYNVWTIIIIGPDIIAEVDLHAVAKCNLLRSRLDQLEQQLSQIYLHNVSFNNKSN